MKSARRRRAGQRAVESGGVLGGVETAGERASSSILLFEEDLEVSTRRQDVFVLSLLVGHMSARHLSMGNTAGKCIRRDPFDALEERIGVNVGMHEGHQSRHLRH